MRLTQPAHPWWGGRCSQHVHTSTPRKGRAVFLEPTSELKIFKNLELYRKVEGGAMDKEEEESKGQEFRKALLRHLTKFSLKAKKSC